MRLIKCYSLPPPFSDINATGIYLVTNLYPTLYWTLQPWIVFYLLIPEFSCIDRIEPFPDARLLQHDSLFFWDLKPYPTLSQLHLLMQKHQIPHQIFPTGCPNLCPRFQQLLLIPSKSKAAILVYSSRQQIKAIYFLLISVSSICFT